MDKSVYVRGHYRKGKYIKGYYYVRTLKSPTFKNGKTSRTYKDDFYRKVVALRKYSDFQSPEYQQAQDYLERTCPEAAFIIGDSETKKLPKITKELYDKITYAYNIIYTK